MKTIALIAILATSIVLTSCKVNDQTSNSNAIVGVYQPVFEMYYYDAMTSETKELGDTSKLQKKVQIDGNGIIRWISIYVKDTSKSNSTYEQTFGEAVTLEMQAPNGFVDSIQSYLTYCDFYNIPDTLQNLTPGTIINDGGIIGYIATFNNATNTNLQGNKIAFLANHKVPFHYASKHPLKYGQSIYWLNQLFEETTYSHRHP